MSDRIGSMKFIQIPGGLSIQASAQVKSFPTRFPFFLTNSRMKGRTYIADRAMPTRARPRIFSQKAKISFRVSRAGPISETKNGTRRVNAAVPQTPQYRNVGWPLTMSQNIPPMTRNGAAFDFGVAQ